jgi:hypothetical protein
MVKTPKVVFINPNKYKMKKLNVFSKMAILALGLITLIACSSDDNGNSTVEEGKAKMSVKLVDAPGDYDEVNIDVEDVVIKYSGGDAETSLNAINVGVYNLLELTGGASVVLADDYEVPAGNISQIRLILGDDNTIVVNGESKPLSTPSAQQSGLKINLNTELEPGISYEYILDFHVEESIVAQGNGGYSLKPVIRATAVAETGIISGNVILPSTAPALVTASNSTTSVSAYTNAQGEFQLYGLPSGSYTLTVDSEASLNLPTITILDVIVVNGEIKVVEDISFN